MEMIGSRELQMPERVENNHGGTGRVITSCGSHGGGAVCTDSPSRHDGWGLSLADTQAMKGVAIGLMLWHHLFDGAREVGGGTWWWGRHGNICVALFLLLSGYGMAARYGRRLAKGGFWREAVECWVHRYWGLFWGYWPVFVPVLAVGVGVFHRGLAEAYGVDGARQWLCLAADFFAFGGYRSYNTTWWFYRLILIQYLLYPFLQRGTDRWCWIWFLVPLLLTGVFDWTGTFCREWILSRWLVPFLAGMLLHEASVRWGQAAERWGWAVWLGGLLASVGGFWIRERWGEGVDGVLAEGMVLALLPIVRRCLPLQKVLEFLGRHSMNVFMVHTFICSYFFRDWVRSFGIPWGQFAVLLGSSLAVSCLLEWFKDVSGIGRIGRNPPAWLTARLFSKATQPGKE